ncbi:MAG: NUDIX hydrolase [Oscillospiraceae bacterium]|nr:NUDIX hydrolase [Oscillospiraceae bacterium]
MIVTEKKVNSSLVYDGHIIKVFKDDVSLEGKPAVREVVRHKGAAAILAIDENQNAYFVEQFRYPMDKALFEASAGKIDEGETPIECAKRELFEECGITAKKWTELGPMYSSPGFCDEVIYLFMAEELSFSNPNPDEDEYLDIIKMPLPEALSLLRKGKIPDAKTQVLILRCADILEHR